MILTKRFDGGRMKKNKLLNSELSYQIAKLGHTDKLVVADAGLPIPSEVNRIDLALTHNIPTFLETLKVLLDEIYIEKITLAQEIKSINPSIHSGILELVSDYELETSQVVTVEYCTHEDFKNMLLDSQSVVRTGECSPYANIILHSGVSF